MAPGVTTLAKTLRSIDDLAEAGLIAGSDRAELARVASRYAVAVSPRMASLIDPGDAADPVARQFVPDARELDTHMSELRDPIGDGIRSPLPAVVHRYADRVLLKVAAVCPVYCRFCFRREMVGPSAGHSPSEAEMAAAFDYIAADPAIWEVIATGGDPFMLSSRRIAALSERLGAIPHVRVMRWHTRVPVVAPELVSADLVAGLRAFPRSAYVGLHVNHPREMTAEARGAIDRLVSAGVPLLSQTVLLRGINDDPATLEALMRLLVEARVLPYYLHHGDLAPGTQHFRVPVAQGQEIAAELNRRLSGIARPDYVLDIPGGYGKVSLLSKAVTPLGDGVYQVRDPSGGVHIYRDACAP